MLGNIGDKYKVIRVIAQGGFKGVGEAYDNYEGINVAVKATLKSPQRIERQGKVLEDIVVNEGTIQRKLRHDNIANLFSVSSHIVDQESKDPVGELLGIEDKDSLLGKKVYIISEELIEGKTIEEKSKEGLSEREILRISYDIANALHYMHSVGILHGDLKADNVMIDNEGNVKIIDFGLSGFKSDELSHGSISTQAPEQHDGFIDEKSEIYSLGAIIYQMATGRNPIVDNEFISTHKGLPSIEFREEVKRKHEHGIDSRVRIHKPDLSKGLEKIVRKAMEKSPDKRFKSMNDFKKSIHWEINKGRNIKRFVFGLAASLLALYTFRLATLPPQYTSAAVYTSTEDGDSEIYSMIWESKKKKKLTDNKVNDKNIVVHPLGERFLWERGPDGQRDIYEMDIHGNHLSQLSSSVRDDIIPAYSHDGKLVIYLRKEQDGINEVHIIEREKNGWGRDSNIYSTKGNIKKLGFSTDNPLILEDTSLKIATSKLGRYVYTVVDNCRDFIGIDDALYFINGQNLYKFNTADFPLQTIFQNKGSNSMLDFSDRIYTLPLGPAFFKSHIMGRIITIDSEKWQVLYTRESEESKGKIGLNSMHFTALIDHDALTLHHDEDPSKSKIIIWHEGNTEEFDLPCSTELHSVQRPEGISPYTRLVK